MAARNPQVGSVAWIAKERSTVKQLEEQDIEDVAYVVRGDMEWLNEHMANIFERNILYAISDSIRVWRRRRTPAH